MPTPAERVRAMAEEGRIDTADAERLLTALEAKPRPSPFRVLFDPFERLGVARGVAIGLASALIAIGVTRLGARFDGFLDAHTSASVPSLVTAALEQLVAWPGGALVLWLSSLVFDRRTRFVDFLAALGVARAPLVAFLAVVAALSPDGDRRVIDVVLIAFAFPCVGWILALIYFGFKHASGLRKAGLVGALVAGVACAEVVSKLVLQARS